MTKFISEHVERSTTTLSPVQKQKLFLLSAHRLANEENSDARRQVEQLMKILVRTHDQNLVDVTLKWSSSREPLKMLIASKMAVILAEVESLKVTQACVRNLLSVFEDDDQKNMALCVVKTNLLEALHHLVVNESKEGVDLAFLSKLTTKISDLFLSPMEGLRKKLLPFVMACIESDSKHFQDWKSEDLLFKVLVNLSELMKTCPSPDLVPVYALLCRALKTEKWSVSVVFDKLRASYNFERKELPLEFERRRTVIEVLRMAFEKDPTWCREAVLRDILAVSDGIEQLSEAVEGCCKLLGVKTEQLSSFASLKKRKIKPEQQIVFPKKKRVSA